MLKVYKYHLLKNGKFEKVNHEEFIEFIYQNREHLHVINKIDVTYYAIDDIGIVGAQEYEIIIPEELRNELPI